MAKQKRPPFHTSIESTVACFDLLHMDIWGPFSTPSMSGDQYFLTIIDDHSRFCWIYLIQLKSKTSKLIKSFVQRVLNTFNNKVKTIRSDNGSEFTMKEFYLKHGIHHQIVCVDTPQ